MNAVRYSWVSGSLAGACGLVLSALCGVSPGDQWESLFNGRDLSGWVPVYDVTFVVKDGNLQIVKGMGWLRTEKEYQDFILEFEWRALDEQYDSGVFIRCGLDGKPWPTDGWQVNLRFDMLGGLVKGYRAVLPGTPQKVPVKQWVNVRLEVKGQHATLDLDGRRVWETDAIDRARGYLGIQAEDKAFDFRNLRIQSHRE